MTSKEVITFNPLPHKFNVGEVVYIGYDKQVTKILIESINYSVFVQADGNIICTDFSYRFKNKESLGVGPFYYHDLGETQEQVMYKTYLEAEKAVKDQIGFEYIDCLKEEEITNK